MNESLQSVANPYESHHPSELDATTRPKRPAGTNVIAALLLFSGIWFGWARCYQLASMFSSTEDVIVHPSYYVSLTRDLVTASTALVGSIAMLVGLKLGWWLSIMHGYWRLAIQGVLPLLGAIAVGTTAQGPSQSTVVSAAIFAGALFLLMVLHLQTDSVRSYFRIQIRRSVVNLVIPIICVGVALGLDVWWAFTQQPIR